MLVGLSVKTSDSLSLSISTFSPRTHPWPLGLVPVIVCISLPSIIARIMISNRSFITCLLFCHYWESMKRLQRISAISAKYSGSREIRSSEGEVSARLLTRVICLCRNLDIALEQLPLEEVVFICLGGKRGR